MMRTATLRHCGRLLTSAVMTVAVAACETTVTDTPLPVASVDLAAAATTIDEGETVQLTATPRSGSGRAMTARSVSYTSSNTAVLTVDGSGLARGVGPGTAAVTARSETAENSVTITVRAANIALTIRNVLVGPITVDVNDQLVGTVPALSTRVFEVPRTTSLTVDWDLVRPRTVQGMEVGEVVGGIFATVTDPAAAIEYEIDNVIAGDTVFAPFITNNSSVPYLMGVNMGLPAENRCQCEVAAGGTSVYLGYYSLVPNANVRAYASGSNYTGTFVFWENFRASIASGSGRLTLTSNLVPAEPIGIRNDYAGGAVTLNPGGLLQQGQSVVHYSNAPLQVGVHDCGEPGSAGCIQDIYTLLPGRSYRVVTHPSGPAANLTIVDAGPSTAAAYASRVDPLPSLVLGNDRVLAPFAGPPALRPATGPLRDERRRR
jgi:Bacterial Ig-like domain (group 2)